MQEYGISELDAAFKVAERIDRVRGIESPALYSGPDAITGAG